MSTPIPDNEACFSGDELRAATGAAGAFDGEVRGVCLDSRTVRPGSLFVALRGENHDAHDYVGVAVERGAAAVLVDRPVDVSGAAVLTVEDTLAALGKLGAAHRGRFDLDVVGVTGSVGKTTTKDLLGAALRALGRTPLVTRGNLNNRVGVPMTLLTLDASHDAAVIEMGMSEPGEIADLAAMAAPRVGIVTAVAEVHTEGVGSIDGVAREKGALLLALPADGAAIWNADEARLSPYADGSAAATKLGYGRSVAAGVRVVEHSVDEHGTRARIAIGERALDVRLALLGAHTAVNAAGALAAILAIEPSRLEEAAAGLADVGPSPHRMCAVPVGDLLVIDDSYNASPRSMQAALAACREIAATRGGGVVAVLGDMLELGPSEIALHEAVGRDAVRSGVKALVACGERMSEAGRAALRETMESAGARAKIVILKRVEDAAECARELVGPRDVVLVKGSRGMRMERVVAALSGADA
ncbi:MAG: UDP-N-acetylmuramoyl-tripeptide--D-alanyl-D-alanine ligase [Sandaracinaceae bacterium]|nr:UDP-N-acetylmuramoyl-tripeptide--D-alanyl-D-alanine ligase [Sandaracinaceae bacterium]